MGAVFRARDLDLDRRVALKVLLPKADAEAGARFLREGRLAAALGHPRIVGLYEVGEVERTPYIAMEWVDGESLHLALRKRPFSLTERLDLLEKIADGLAHAHEHGIVHRDLKPTNVIVD